jgi:hypothetical protein
MALARRAFASSLDSWSHVATKLSAESEHEIPSDAP